MIKEAYCSKEVAKLLKEKGFDVEKCTIAYYCDCLVDYTMFGYCGDEELIFTPTHQMAMAWLREEKNCIISIWYTGGGFYVADYYIEDDNEEIHDIIGTYNTYNEAVEESLKDVLTNLI